MDGDAAEPSSAWRLLLEGQALWSEYTTGGDRAQEDRALAVLARAVEQADREGDPALRGVTRSSLGTMRVARYEMSGAQSDVDSGVELLTAALRYLPPDHGEVPGALATLASASLHRYHRSGVARHLTEAVETARRGIEAVRDPRDFRLGGWHSNLGGLLRLRFELTGNERDLDEAIVSGRRALECVPPADRALALGALIGHLIQRAVRRGDLTDAAEALAAGREALAAMPPGYVARYQVIGAAVSALRFDHQMAGHRASLDEAIDLQRELTASLPEGRPDAGIHFSNLSELLRLRYEQLGTRSDLDEAVDTARRAEEANTERARAPHLAATRCLAARALSTELAEKGDKEGATVAATESVAAARRIVSGSAGNPLLLARGLLHQANALLALAVATGERDRQSEALACLEQAAGIAPADDPQRAVLLTTMGLVGLNALPDDAGADALDPVVTQLRQAAVLGGDSGPNASQAAANLVVALFRRHRDTGRPEDLAELLKWSDTVLEADTTPPPQRVRIANLAAGVLMETGDHREAAQRYARAVELLPMTAWQGADRASVETQLTEARGLASDAAAARLTADGNAEAALVLLETGRGVMWTRMLQLRAESTALQREHPELATRLAEIASRLTLLDGDGESAGLVPLSPSQRIDHRARLAREYRDLVRQAVAAGHGDFLAPPSREELLSAAAAGPVVVVNISRWRCDALVVTTAGVTACPLPGLDAARVEEWAAAHLAAQHRVDRAHAALHRARTAGVNPAAFRAQHDARNEVRQATRHAETMLERVLGLLWDTVAEPVLAHLAETGSAPSAGRAAHGASPADVGGGDRPATPEQDDAPRLWWCPTGALALLPLHAAGHYESSPDAPAPAGGPRTLLDRFTCSSVPTVRALARARTVPRHHAGEPGAAGAGRMLMVAMPETPGQPPLPEVDEEQALLRTLFPAALLTVRTPPEATRAVVREDLRRHDWVHVSCHGTQDLDAPSSGGLLLVDGMLTVADIGAGQHRGEFILLSACRTVTGGRGLPDEAISLGAALHYSGYRHVVGTQWSVDARAAERFGASVHTALASDGGYTPERAAAAVRGAALRLRADTGLPRFSWTPFTHTGP
ncbi:CHAT domain-containing protein [Streptomyces sp. NBC_00670]|uniref:CHAT domain-containing protein n=1 Tax=Streptomyces sp. NBC_00670 TaxID=2975804 RepID=UPI002E35E5F1|nr:CHAT domain-containing protein [Streptomyces sp. NBC_00670]